MSEAKEEVERLLSKGLNCKEISEVMNIQASYVSKLKNELKKDYLAGEGNSCKINFSEEICDCNCHDNKPHYGTSKDCCNCKKKEKEKN